MRNKAEVNSHGERAILIIRSFNALRALVFDAMSKPEMLKHWLHGPAGWTMTTVEMDLRVGGSYRWAWTNDDGREMGMGGRVLKVAPPEKIVTTERFDDPWYSGEARNTVVLTEENGVTTMYLTVEYESTAARNGVLAGPIASGLDSSYDRLDTFLAT